MESTAVVPVNIQEEIASRGEEAFSKALASAIMAEFPIASIIAIFMALKAQKVVKSTYDLAEQNHVNVGGKCMAAKVLAMVGKIAGIVMTGFWAFYSIWLTFYIIFMVIIGVAGSM